VGCACRSYCRVYGLPTLHAMKTSLCKLCGEDISAKRSRTLFCSYSCAGKYKVATRSDELRASHSERLRERARTNPLQSSSVTNCNAKSWRLRSPSNTVYEFRNLLLFVKENQNLFDPSDVIPHKSSPRGCRASVGLNSLNPYVKSPRGSWKGWIWYSQTERRVNDCQDLLDRTTP